MGRDNREPAFFTPEEEAEVLWSEVARNPYAGSLLRRLAGMDIEAVNRTAERLALQLVSTAWVNGWQPAELLRQGRRATSSSAAARLVGLAIANDNANRRAATLDARWMAQVEALALPPANGRSGWLGRWAIDEGADRVTALNRVADAIRTLRLIPPLDVLIPPPGAGGPTGAGAAGSDRTHSWLGHRQASAESDPVLTRVRNLLAKAESTQFEAEATAFTAKAQELMTRHAIDMAMLGHGAVGDNEEPIMIRIPLDAPYVDAKALLLHVVAEAGRCRSAQHGRLDLAVVMGFAHDVAAVEMLFTSLLVQAQAALAAAGENAPPGTRVRSQAFRSAFLVAFASRIGDRLRAINERVVETATAESGGSFQLVLRDRSDAVEEAFNRRFSRLTERGVRGGYDGAGYASGRQAADRAKLSAADLSTPTP